MPRVPAGAQSRSLTSTDTDAHAVASKAAQSQPLFVPRRSCNRQVTLRHGRWRKPPMISRILDHLEEWLIATLIATATLIIFVAVLHRYSAGLSADLARWATAHEYTALADAAGRVFRWVISWDLSWAQELCIFMFVWMAKFGAAYGVRTGIH